jgi:hypothetical protein
LNSEASGLPLLIPKEFNDEDKPVADIAIDLRDEIALLSSAIIRGYYPPGKNNLMHAVSREVESTGGSNTCTYNLMVVKKS